MNYVKSLLMLTLLFIAITSITEGSLAKKQYRFTDDPIDVVIPCCRNDLDTLDLCIAGIRKNCSQIRRVIVVSSEPFTDEAEWFDEKNYPFNKESIALYLLSQDTQLANQYLSKPNSRVGWYYQQLLKLYASFVIPHLSPNLLIVDADAIFLRPVVFLDEFNCGLYTAGGGGLCGIQYHRPYFDHAEKLIPGLEKVFPNYSGIAHHMLFQKPVLDDLFNEVKTTHGTELWKAFCQCVEIKEIHGSGASEYEIYFNFVFGRTNQVSIRHLEWAEIPLNYLPFYRLKGYDYVACHYHMR